MTAPRFCRRSCRNGAPPPPPGPPPPMWIAPGPAPPTYTVWCPWRLGGPLCCLAAPCRCRPPWGPSIGGGGALPAAANMCWNSWPRSPPPITFGGTTLPQRSFCKWMKYVLYFNLNPIPLVQTNSLNASKYTSANRRHLGNEGCVRRKFSDQGSRAWLYSTTFLWSDPSKWSLHQGQEVQYMKLVCSTYLRLFNLETFKFSPRLVPNRPLHALSRRHRGHRPRWARRTPRNSSGKRMTEMRLMWSKLFLY